MGRLPATVREKTSRPIRSVPNHAPLEGPGSWIYMAKAFLRVIPGEYVGKETAEDPEPDEKHADDERGTPGEQLQSFPPSLLALRGHVLRREDLVDHVLTCEFGRRNRLVGARIVIRVHQLPPDSRARGFIHAMIRSAVRVAAMKMMPTRITPAVRTGRSDFSAALRI